MFPLERLLIWQAAGQILRVAFVLYLFGSLWVAGRFTGRLLRLAVSDAFSERLIEVGLGFAVFSFAVRVLGAIGLARSDILFGLLLLPALGFLVLRRRGLVPAFSAPPLEKKWALGLLALLPLPMALAPAVSYDALVYQLRFPEVTLQSGTWAFDAANSTSAFPAASQALYLFGLAADPSGICAQLIHYGFFLLSLGALIALARAIGSGSGGEIAAILFASLPAAGVVAGWSWSDMTLCFALLASALALQFGQIAPGVALMGLAASTKYSGLPLALPLAAVAVVIAVRRRRAGPLLAGIAAASLIAAPWYLANWTHFRNPFYPLLPRLFGGDAETAGRILNWHGSSPWEWLSYVSRPETLDSDLGGIGLALCIVAAISYCVTVRRHVRIVVVVLASFGTLAVFEPAARILLPPFAGGCLLVALAFEERRPGRQEWLSLALVGLLAVRGAFLIAAHNALFFDPFACAIGVETPEDYRRRNFPADALYERAGAVLPAGARLLVFGEARLFRFPRPTVASSGVDIPAFLPFLRGAADANEVVSRIRQGGFTHLLVATDALRPGPEALVWRRGLSDPEVALLGRTLERCRPLDRQGFLHILELPPAAAGPGRP